MKTLNEIFETNKELLNEPEVKELIEQFGMQFQHNVLKYENYWQKITDLTMNSELFVLKGMSTKDVVSKIYELSFK